MDGILLLYQYSSTASSRYLASLLSGFPLGSCCHIFVHSSNSFFTPFFLLVQGEITLGFVLGKCDLVGSIGGGMGCIFLCIGYSMLVCVGFSCAMGRFCRVFCGPYYKSVISL